MKVMFKKIFIVFLVIAVNGCVIDPRDDAHSLYDIDSDHGDCYMPPHVSSGQHKKYLTIFANPADSTTKGSYTEQWLDTGIIVSNVANLKISQATGAISLCDTSIKQIVLPYSECFDGTQPRYEKLKKESNAQTTSTTEYTYNPKSRVSVTITGGKSAIDTIHNQMINAVSLIPIDNPNDENAKSRIVASLQPEIFQYINTDNELTQNQINYIFKTLNSAKSVRTKIRQIFDTSFGYLVNDAFEEFFADSGYKITRYIFGNLKVKALYIDPDGDEVERTPDTTSDVKNIYFKAKQQDCVSIANSMKEFINVFSSSAPDNARSFIQKIDNFLAKCNNIANSNISNSNLQQIKSIAFEGMELGFPAIFGSSSQVYLSYDNADYVLNRIYTTYIYKKLISFLYDNLVLTKTKTSTQNIVAKKRYYTGDIKDLCPSPTPKNLIKDYFKPTMDYKKTGIMLTPGDIITVSLTPKEIVISDCNNIPDEISPGTHTFPGSKAPTPTSSMCRGMDLTMHDGTPIKLFPLQKPKSLITEDPSPAGNKTTYDVFPDNNFIGPIIEPFKSWAGGTAISFTPHTTDDLKKLGCSGDMNDTSGLMAEADLYSINHACGNSSGYYGINFSKFMMSYSDLADLIRQNKTPNISTAGPIGAIIMKIGGDTKFDSSGQECITSGLKNTVCTSSPKAFLFNKQYKVSSSGELMAIIYDNKDGYFNNLGGYTMGIKKECPYSDGERLYIYIGRDPKNVKPGDPDTSEIKITTASGAKNIDLSKYKLNDRVYVGIKPRDDSNFKAGHYDITLNYQEVKVLPSIAIGRVFDKIRDVISFNSQNSYVKKGFGDITKNISSAIKAAMVLYVTFIGIGYIIGTVPFTKEYLINSMIRIGLIIQLISPGGWEFFNNLFFKHIAPMINTMINMASLNDTAADDFSFFDKAFGALINEESWRKLLSVGLSGPIGLVVVCILFYAYWKFLVLAMKGLLMYAMALMAIAFLIIMFPLFLVFILFKQTRYLFDAWMKMIVGYIAQPAFYFISIGFMIQILQYAIDDIFYFELCKTCVFGLLLEPPGFFKFIARDAVVVFCFVDGWLPKSYITYNKDGGGGWYDVSAYANEIGEIFTFGMPFGLNVLFFFIVVLKSMEVMAKVSQTMASTIVGFSYAHEGLSAATDKMIGSGKKLLGMDKQSKDRRQGAQNALKKLRQNIGKAKREGIKENSQKDNNDIEKKDNKKLSTNIKKINMDLETEKSKKTTNSNDLEIKTKDTKPKEEKEEKYKIDTKEKYKKSPTYDDDKPKNKSTSNKKTKR